MKSTRWIALAGSGWPVRGSLFILLYGSLGCLASWRVAVVLISVVLSREPQKSYLAVNVPVAGNGGVAPGAQIVSAALKGQKEGF